MPSTPPRWIPVAGPVIGEREVECVTDAVRSGWVSSIGPYLDRFERGFAEFCGVAHAVAVSNGTVALQLALRALGIGPGDEVLIPDLTFAATAHAVLDVGAVPVLVDVDPVTWCMDPRAVERALTARTRAIMPVHLYGHPADMDAIMAIAAPRKLLVIEDAAEAHGARIGSQRVGSFGVASAFSFYGNKLMTTGEGGALVTNDEALASRFRFLKDHGMSKERRYYHSELAFNYRMTNLQAALGVAQLEQVESFIQKKRLLMRWYREALDGVPGLTLNAEKPGTTNVYWMVSAVLGAELVASRDAVCSQLREVGVDTRPFFVPMGELPHLKGFRRCGATGDACPVAAKLSARGLNLPSGVSLTREDVDYVASALRNCLH
ncbi:MAG: perosamine synthetase [Polyangiaceae bacterium]